MRQGEVLIFNLTEKERDTSSPQSLMGETTPFAASFRGASLTSRGTRPTQWIPKTALPSGFTRGKQQRILSLIPSPWI